MKIWRKSRLSENHANSFANGRTRAIYAIMFMALVAFSLASCSSDDDEEFQMDQLAGTWEQVYDAGVVAEGTVQYTFTPGTPATGGQCTIHVSDVFAGDTTFVRHLTNSDVVLNFKKIK